MSQNPQRASEIFNIKTIPFSEIPNQSRLFVDFQNNAVDVQRFYPEKNTSLPELAEKVLQNYKVDRDELCKVLTETNRSINAGAKTLENIEKLKDENCLAIVTGQQAGLFSGAVYTIYKALSAIKFAEELQQQNIKAVPVFWIAEEDHDFDEVKKTTVLDTNSQLKAFENTPKNYQVNAPVGFVKFDETIEQTIRDLFSELLHTEFSAQIKEIIKNFYKDGETYSTAFAKFLSEIFRNYGLIIVLPLNKKLKKLCAPFVAETIEKSDEIVSVLLERDEELHEKNYHSQVLVEKDSFPYFYQDENNQRHALRKNLKTGEIVSKTTNKIFKIKDLIEVANASPENLSPNALLRPLVQDYLFPTLTYFGGGAEIAYFAQNSAVYQLLDRPVTPIRHRASFTIIEPKNRRTFNKYSLDFKDLFNGEESVKAGIVDKYLNTGTAKVFAEVKDAVNLQIKLLEESLTESEITLANNAANRRKKVMWHIAALKKKFHKAEILKHETVNRRVENLFNSLLPDGVLQERNVNVITFLNLYGLNFIDWIYSATDSGEKDHQLLIL